MRSAVFLDRDDTLIANAGIAARMPHAGYLYDPALVELLPGVGEACQRLKSAGYALVVVTNQSSVARGYCDVDAVEATNRRVREVLRESAGVELDGVYTCLFSPDGTVAPYNVDHPWRKPRGGMLRWASDDLRLDLSRSWMIGDAQRDIDAGLDAGLDLERTLLVGSGKAVRFGARFAGLLEAAEHILRSVPRAPGAGGRIGGPA